MNKIHEYDLLEYLCENNGAADEEQIAEHFDVEREEIVALFNRLMMRGYAAPGYIAANAKGRAMVDQMEAELRDAGPEEMWSADPDFKVAEQAGYLYANGWDKTLPSVHIISMLLSFYRLEPYVDNLDLPEE